MNSHHRMSTASALVAIALGAIALGVSALSITAQTPPSADQLATALKQNLAESQKRLRRYEWIETTTIVFKGEQKSQKQQRVYYGADGTLTKLPIGEPAEPAPAQGGGGRRGGRLKQRVVENKKDEMREYMEKAAALIHQYVPPDPVKVQAAKDAGKMQVRPQPGGPVQVEFRDYLQPADLLSIGVDATAAQLAALTVVTYLEKPEDAVNLAVRFATLADGTGYSAESTLDVKAKSIRVVVANSGHRPLGAP